MMINLEDYLTSFEHYLKNNLSLSCEVVKAHVRRVSHYIIFIKKEDLYEQIESRELVDFYIKTLAISDNGLRCLLSSLEHFYRYLIFRRLISVNPIQKIKRPQENTKYYHYVSYDSIVKIINAPDTSTPKGLRDKTLFILLYSTGMRANELCKLTIPDIDFTNALIRVKSKGNERLIPLHKYAMAALSQYLHQRHLLLSKNVPYLFVNNHGRQFKYHTLRKMLNKYLARAKIKEPFTTHTFRHAYASHMIMAGANVRMVQFLLGHQSIDTTQVYVQLHQDHLKKLHNKHHPRATFEKIKEMTAQYELVKND